MWLIWYQRGSVVLSPGYKQYWDSRQDALKWAEEQGYDMSLIMACPVVWEET
jgi:hypothetical protein